MFPDTYEIGMSHLGLAILYHTVNREPSMLAERGFMPWADMERGLIERGIPLFSLESQRSIREFDIVGFSLAYELSYTNVLAVLSLSDIPLRGQNRAESDPFVIAGGPCAFNPMPVAPFFDAIVIGDGEDAIIEISNVVMKGKCEGRGREEILNRLAKIKGVFVPSIWNSNPYSVSRAAIANLDSAPYPKAPVVPYFATHERLAVEVARGCARGCRFCQAGFIYRPVRQRSGALSSSLACDGIRNTGAEEFSFLSLSVGDWAPLDAALKDVHESLKEFPVNASLPSLRAESLSQDIIRELGPQRAGGFTLAPEAATKKMRRRINKGNTDDDLYSSVERVFQNGWHAVKLYFMVGLPGETDEELDGIVKIANRCLDIGRKYHRRPEVTVSTSTFVPKSHTPFQWERQISIEEMESIQRKLKKILRRPGLFYRWHDAKMSFLEGVFSRGSLRLADAIELAFEKGARFDAWDECFDLQRWMEAFAETGIVPGEYLKERAEDEVFPWDGLAIGPSREFLATEREKARMLESTKDCTRDACSSCGMCDFAEVRNKIAVSENIRTFPLGDSSPLRGNFAPHRTVRGPHIEAAVPLPSLAGGNYPSRALELSSSISHTYRVQYKKVGASAFLGAIETLNTLRRAFRAAGFNLCYTQGYHPRAKISAGPALPTGIESNAEFVDVEVLGEVEVKAVRQALAAFLPEGMEVVSAWELGARELSIMDDIETFVYEVQCDGNSADPESIVRRFDSPGPILFQRVRKEKRIEIDIKSYVTALAVLSPCVLEVVLQNRLPALKIFEILLGLAGENFKPARIIKTKVKWRQDAK